MVHLLAFSNKEITKENILKYEFELLKGPTNFEIDYKCDALLNVSDDKRFSGNTLVIHEKYGAFLVEETTKELVNKFYKRNAVGFALSKVLANFFSLKHYVPFVFMYVVYMPISGGTRKNTDWIGLHLMNSCRQNKKEAYFITTQGFIIKVTFPKGDLDRRVHDACVLCEKCVAFFLPLIIDGGIDVKGCSFTGLVVKFGNCHCPLHNKVKCDNDPQIIGLMFINFIIDHLGIESVNPEEEKKHYRRFLSRLKKHY
ncbi:hypothetical protein [Companilactobacillus farciminis]|uniref:hypothetical protein n=1 Tax=Companilactobacillus farciminis TaxID=1612 RepID=UPI00232CE6DE|nr:hypothetical protein [Companilactobacillus farciminis]WCG35944.1 hypothetical protein PML84_01825 [Companilactobacillus farciminis]